MKNFVRSSGVALASAALLSAGLAASVSAPAGAAPAAAPTTPEGAAVAWLRGELNDSGLLGTADFSNVTGSIDFGLGLARTGADDELLAQLVTGLNAALPGYIGAPEASKPAQVAKSAAFYAEAADARDAGGIDLIERLEAHVDDESGQLGSVYVDLFNQSSAVFALNDAGSSEAAKATEFLIGGQCDDGGWGYEDETGCHPDADTTALAVTGLLPQKEAPLVAASIDAGVDWLVAAQAADGAFGEGQWTPDNSNSTGLAGWALQEAGSTQAAAKAATWVRSHQLTAGACDQKMSGEQGAIAYSDGSLAEDLVNGLPTVRAEITMATAQAFPVLTFAPAASGALRVAGPAFIKADSATTVTVSGVAPGERVCFGNGAKRSALSGTAAVLKVRVTPAKNSKIVVTTLAGQSQASSVVLGAKKLKPTVKKTVRRGAKQIVKVTGLAHGESVKVKLGKKKVGSAKANAKGVVKVSFKVTKKTKRGKATITVTGQFKNRVGSKKFTVK